MTEVNHTNQPEAVKIILDQVQEIKRLLEKINQYPSSEPSDQWFDLDGLCAYLPDKPVRSTVYTWTSNHSIPFHRKGKKLAFLRSEINLWIKSGRKQTTEEIAMEAEAFAAKQNEKTQKK